MLTDCFKPTPHLFYLLLTETFHSCHFFFFKAKNFCNLSGFSYLQCNQDLFSNSWSNLVALLLNAFCPHLTLQPVWMHILLKEVSISKVLKSLEFSQMKKLPETNLNSIFKTLTGPLFWVNSCKAADKATLYHSTWESCGSARNNQ